MKQSSLDIVMNIVLYDIYSADISKEDRDELLEKLKMFFINYDKISACVEKEKIETIDFTKVR